MHEQIIIVSHSRAIYLHKVIYSSQLLIKFKQMKAYESFLPVDPDFFDISDSLINKEVKVFYFGVEKTLEESKGINQGILKEKNGDFMYIKSGRNVRIDRIITINGKPGPAFDEYDAYANACLSCQAGYDD